jgi:hypothetical protein
MERERERERNEGRKMKRIQMRKDGIGKESKKGVEEIRKK